MELVLPSDESKVLVIYTGGTIGMLVGQQGYVPEPYFLTETLRSQARFHDPLQDSLFSHSASVEGFRQWSSNPESGRSSPTAGRFAASSGLLSTLRVRSSHPIGVPSGLPLPDQHLLQKQPHCTKISDDLYEAHVPALVTPRTAAPGGGGKRIRYAVLEWNPLLDSSNIDIDDWIRIATEIELNYSLYDAFVVLHGTDTMAYTSSALSFLLEDLGKTVILTGAQIPLSQLRNDAVDNFLGALTIAGLYIIPECCLFFNHTLYRGNRVSKVSSHDFNAFTSPNFAPLVNVGIDIVVNWNDVIRPTTLRRFRAHKEMSPHVATLRLFPGITAATIRAFLTPPIRGVVLETFGAGNAPQRKDLMDTLREACDSGVVIVAISQCAKGSVSDAYETGRTLLQAGIVSGGDMTPESALAKLGYLLSKPELSPAEVRSLIGMPLRGELTRPSGLEARHSPVESDLQSVEHLLARIVNLSAFVTPSTPKIVVSSELVDASAKDAAASAPWTAAEAASTEGALLSFLIHLAAAADDVEALSLCLTSGREQVEAQQYQYVTGDLVNCINPASGRAPLHVAALNGSVKCVRSLLAAGALVHLRDTLGHTALYYAARQRHENVVAILVKAGADLGGADVEGGYVTLAIKKAVLSADEQAIKIWDATGIKVSSGDQEGSKDIIQ
ncbi:L-asparaginase [Dentipellis sp. KUC8613]|nr:L-asparaginase [Dentipellis sp. KUC8613]